jgi:hypothetical protein
VSPSPCVPAGPTGCDVALPKEGDADCSGTVDTGDVSALLSDFAGLQAAACRIYANVKCDDELNVLDALFILQYKADFAAQIPAWCPPIGAMIIP